MDNFPTPNPELTRLIFSTLKDVKPFRLGLNDYWEDFLRHVSLADLSDDEYLFFQEHEDSLIQERYDQAWNEGEVECWQDFKEILSILSFPTHVLQAFCLKYPRLIEVFESFMREHHPIPDLSWLPRDNEFYHYCKGQNFVGEDIEIGLPFSPSFGVLEEMAREMCLSVHESFTGIGAGDDA